MADAVCKVVGIQSRDATAVAVKTRNFKSDPLIAASADVPAQRAEQGSAEQEIAGKTRDEAGVVGERNENDIGVEALNRGLISNDEQRQRNGGSNEPCHYV